MNLSTTTPLRNASTAGTAFTSKRLTNLKKIYKFKKKSLIRLSPHVKPLNLLYVAVDIHNSQIDVWVIF